MTYLCRTRLSVTGALQRTFDKGDSKGSGVTWRRRRHGRGRVVDHILWDPPHHGRLRQVSWWISLGGGQQLASGVQQPS